MSTQVPVCITLKAAADLSTKQYHFVELTASDTVNACNGTTDKAIGILQNKPTAAGQPAVVAIAGVSKLVAGGALATAGSYLATKADGRAQAAASTQYARAQQITTAGADGDVLEALLVGPWLLA